MKRLLIVVLLLTACAEAVEPATTLTTSTTIPTTTTSTPDSALDAARALWEGAALDTYHFVFQDDCGECMPEWAVPRVVTVWDGAVFDGRQQGFDVDALFTVIEAAEADGRTVEVVYDSDLGFPTDLWIDREARAYDGGTHLLVSDLTPGLPGADVSVSELDAAWDMWSEVRPEAYEFRTDIVCGCPFDVSTWTRVNGDRIVDWQIERGDSEVAPITVDQLFADLRELISEGEVVSGGARITGRASYHPTLGHPMWVGLDVEILDPDSELGSLPPRLVYIVHSLVEDAGAAEAERAMARWVEVGPVDYVYELTIHDIEEGSFSDPHIVVVTGGTVSSVTADGVEIHPDNVPAYAVLQLFDEIQTWEAVGFDVEVLYDARLGHPVFVGVDTGTEVTAFSIDNLRPR